MATASAYFPGHYKENYISLAMHQEKNHNYDCFSAQAFDPRVGHFPGIHLEPLVRDLCIRYLWKTNHASDPGSINSVNKRRKILRKVRLSRRLKLFVWLLAVAGMLYHTFVQSRTIWLLSEFWNLHRFPQNSRGPTYKRLSVFQFAIVSSVQRTNLFEGFDG